MSDMASEQAVAPGTEGVPGAYEDPNASAETLNTGGQPVAPGPIPYDRFKEVNDQLRPYKDLERVGYDADSLRGLVEWETTFRNDPITNWLTIAKNIDGLPEGVAMAIADYYDEPYDSSDGTDDEGVDEESDGTEQVGYANPLQDERVRASVEYVEQKRVEEEQNQRLSVVNEVLERWKAADEAQGIESIPEKNMLTFIAGTAGTAMTKDDVFNNARSEWLEVSGHAQKSMVRPGLPGLPPSVPGGAAPTTSDRPRPKTFSEMNKLIEAANAQGLLGG